ncbi:hypothetical protein CDAR_548141 [Caerostris darwini]|uniref:Uncharacterized protein n=1 Tax=Caerostris darwini TaxID=1538125 RepID=A0AAV4WGK2_9ARAC|nr:hypothetical protein CDAR_548141 [Caerostris darwini]
MEEGGDHKRCGFDSARFVDVAVICSIAVAGSIQKGVRIRFSSSVPISGSNYRLRNNRGWKAGGQSQKGGDDCVFRHDFDSARFVVVAVICSIAVVESIQKGVRARFLSSAGSWFKASLSRNVLIDRR